MQQFFNKIISTKLESWLLTIKYQYIKFHNQLVTKIKTNIGKEIDKIVENVCTFTGYQTVNKLEF